MDNNSNGMATASMVLGIVGMFIPGITSILAIIFGGVGISKANKGAEGKGKAVAGLVLGIIAAATWILLYNFIFAAAIAAAGTV